jgi:hypothetical protein
MEVRCGGSCPAIGGVPLCRRMEVRYRSLDKNRTSPRVVPCACSHGAEGQQSDPGHPQRRASRRRQRLSPTRGEIRKSRARGVSLLLNHLPVSIRKHSRCGRRPIADPCSQPSARSGVGGPARFPAEKIMTFGMTYSYTQIADTSFTTGRYSARCRELRAPLRVSQIAEETRRKPLYPASLIALELPDDPTPISFYQRLALSLALTFGVCSPHGTSVDTSWPGFSVGPYAPACSMSGSSIHMPSNLLITCGMLTAIQGLRTGAWAWFRVGRRRGRLATSAERLLLPAALGSGLRPAARRTTPHLAVCRHARRHGRRRRA